MQTNIDFFAVAKYCKEKYPERAEQVLSVANDVLQNHFLFNMPWDMERTEEAVDFKDKINWNYKLNGDPEFLFQLNRHVYFIWLVESYYLTGDEKYLEKVASLWEDFLENVPIKVGQTTPYRSLEVGMRAEFWLRALAMFQGTKYCTEALKAKIDACLKEHVRILKEEHASFQNSSNWGIIQDSGLFLLGIYFHDEEVKKLAIARLKEETSLQILPDGMQWEQSSGYHNAVLFCLLNVVMAAEFDGYALPEILIHRIVKMAEVNLKWLKPNRHHPLMGDSDDNDIQDVLSRCAMVLHRGEFKTFAFAHLDWDSAFLFGEDGIKAYDAMEAKEPTFLNAVLQDSGQAIIRSDWSNKADWLHFVNGETGGGHSHADKLHIDVMLDGRDVLVDAGRYTYKSGASRSQIKSAMMHNTTILAGKPFLQPLNAWSVKGNVKSLQGPMIENEHCVLVEGGHLGYLHSDGLYMQRSILLLKPNILVLLDSFFAKGYKRYRQYFHFAPNGCIHLMDNTVCYKDAVGKVYLHILNAKAKLKAQDSLYSSNYNAVCKNDAIELAFSGRGLVSSAAVLVKNEDEQHPVKVSSVKAIMHSTNVPMPKSVAEGIVIKAKEATYTICIAHEDQRNVFLCNGKKALAKITVYKNDEMIFTRW